MKNEEFAHSNEPIIVFAKWKNCLHISDCTCSQKRVHFQEYCQTCGEPATLSMGFSSGMKLFKCDNC